MSNENYWEDENDSDLDNNPNENNGMNNLRKAKRADEKYIKELEERLGQYIAKDYERTVSEILKSKGVNTKAARLILNDLDTVDEESVSKWLIDNGDLIGFQPQQENKAIDDTDVQALKRQDDVTGIANSTPVYSDDIEKALLNANSEEEIMSIIKSLG